MYLHAYVPNEEIVVMSSQKFESLSRFLAIGSAALLIQLGGVAVASQQPDIQGEMQQVLSGHIAAPLTSPAQASRGESSRSTSDSQAFARRLLQGWSASAVAGTRPAKKHHVAANSPKYQDVQAMVRRQLLGA
jgi:hypothetical protein